MSRREAGASRPGREVIQQNHWSRIPPNNASNVTSRRRAKITCIQPTSRERAKPSYERLWAREGQRFDLLRGVFGDPVRRRLDVTGRIGRRLRTGVVGDQ